MKTGIKLERPLTPKDNVTQNSDCVVLTPITANHNNGRLKRVSLRINPAQPTVQYRTKKSLIGLSLLQTPLGLDNGRIIKIQKNIFSLLK